MTDSGTTRTATDVLAYECSNLSMTHYNEMQCVPLTDSSPSNDPQAQMRTCDTYEVATYLPTSKNFTQSATPGMTIRCVQDSAPTYEYKFETVPAFPHCDWKKSASSRARCDQLVAQAPQTAVENVDINNPTQGAGSKYWTWMNDGSVVYQDTPAQPTTCSKGTGMETKLSRCMVGNAASAGAVATLTAPALPMGTGTAFEVVTGTGAGTVVAHVPAQASDDATMTGWGCTQKTTDGVASQTCAGYVAQNSTEAYTVRGVLLTPEIACANPAFLSCVDCLYQNREEGFSRTLGIQIAGKPYAALNATLGTFPSHGKYTPTSCGKFDWFAQWSQPNLCLVGSVSVPAATQSACEKVKGLWAPSCTQRPVLPVDALQCNAMQLLQGETTVYRSIYRGKDAQNLTKVIRTMINYASMVPAPPEIPPGETLNAANILAKLPLDSWTCTDGACTRNAKRVDSKGAKCEMYVFKQGGNPNKACYTAAGKWVQEDQPCPYTCQGLDASQLAPPSPDKCTKAGGQWSPTSFYKPGAGYWSSLACQATTTTWDCAVDTQKKDVECSFVGPSGVPTTGTTLDPATKKETNTTVLLDAWKINHAIAAHVAKTYPAGDAGLALGGALGWLW